MCCILEWYSRFRIQIYTPFTVVFSIAAKRFPFMRHDTLLAAVVVLCASPLAHGFTITPTFSNSPTTDASAQNWTATEEAVVMEAVSDWTSILSYTDPSQNIPMTFQFTAAGTAPGAYLGLWVGNYSANEGDNVTPWSPDMTQIVNINTDFMVPRAGSPTLVFTTGGIPVAQNTWDALSVLRHELGHALGLTTLYTSFATGSTPDPNSYLLSHVNVTGTSAVFDQSPGGLNIPLASFTNVEHVADNNDLMSVSLNNGVRKSMSFTDIEELSATQGYAVTIPAGSTYTSTTFKTQTITLNGAVHVTSTTATRNTASTVLQAQNLTINSGGLLDISNHDLIINGGQTLASVQGLITAGLGGATGITSSTAASGGETLGIATAGALNVSTFDGLAVSPSSILVKYTFLGDATLDGKVDLSDLNVVLNNLGTTTSLWSSGNFDKAATIDLTDLNDVLNHLGVSVPAGSSVLATAQALLAAGGAVPEPASLSLLAMAVPLLLRKRRR
jgi:hypothetical protein